MNTYGLEEKYIFFRGNVKPFEKYFLFWCLFCLFFVKLQFHFPPFPGCPFPFVHPFYGSIDPIESYPK